MKKVTFSCLLAVTSGLSVAAIPSAFAQQAPANHTNTSSETIPADFRGKITYTGSYEGTMSTPPRMPGKLDFGSMLGAAMSAKSEPYRGGSVYEVEYDGAQVKGSFREQGTFNATGTFTGTRAGTTCNMVTNQGLRYTAECSMTRYFIRLSFTDDRGRKFKSVIDTNRTGFVDYAERDRLAAINAEKARVAAAEAAARYAALPNAGPALTKKFDGLVQIDSRGWAFNRYSPGSMRNVKIVSGKAGVGTYVMRGEYTYNGGQTGWVMAEMNGQNLSCIQFWDAVMGCRGLRTPEQGQAMRSAVANGLMGGGSSSQGSSGCRRQSVFVDGWGNPICMD